MILAGRFCCSSLTEQASAGGIPQVSHPLQSTLVAFTVATMNRSLPVGDLPAAFTGNSFTDDFLAQLDLTDSAAPAAAGDCIRVLDVGTGTARIPIEICRRHGDIRITAVERAARAAQTARRNVERAGLTFGIRIEQADALSLPFADGSFGAVISNSLLHHVPDQAGVLREMTRVLSPGGLLFIRDTLQGADSRQIAEVLATSRETGARRQAVFETAFGAMLTIDGARDLAVCAGLPPESVYQSGTRHWMLAFRRQPSPVEVNYI